MALDNHHEFIAVEKDLTFYSGKAVINRVNRFYDNTGSDYLLTSNIGLFFVIYEEREEGRIVFESDHNSGLSTSVNDIIFNFSVADMSIPIGNYYYELGYVVDGGYEIILAYGSLRFI